jgi:hypothetical protein
MQANTIRIGPPAGVLHRGQVTVEFDHPSEVEVQFIQPGHLVDDLRIEPWSSHP